MIEDTKAKHKETMLTLCVAWVVLFLVSETHPLWMLYIAVVLGVTGMFFNHLSAKIHWAWMKLAEGMGWVMSKVILTAVFYSILLPVAVLSRLSGNRNMQLTKKEGSYFHSRNHTYSKKDLEQVW